MLYILATLSLAQCPLKQEKQNTIVDIQSSDIPLMKEKSIGCTTLLELWASWCKPCIDIKAPLRDALSKYPNLHRVPISADYTRGALKKYLKKQNVSAEGHYHLSFWSVDGLQKDYAKLGARFEGAIPFLVLLSKEGTILYAVTEPNDLSGLEAALETYLPAQEK